MDELMSKVDVKLLELLVFPLAQGRLTFGRDRNELVSERARLAYPIRHNSADLRDGFYTLYHFEIKPEGIEDIEREIRLNERIIRHLMLVLDNEPIFVEEVEEGAEGEVVEAVIAEGTILVETPNGVEAVILEDLIVAEPVAEVIEVVDGEVVEVAEVVEIEVEPVVEVVEVADVVEVEPVAEVVEVVASEEE